MPQIKKALKVIWWLSVDNYISKCNPENKSLLQLFIDMKIDNKFDQIIHLVQSEYAHEY